MQDTPIAVTAFTGTELEERQIFKTDRLDEVVPNLQFANNAPLAGNNSSSRCSSAASARPIPTSTVDPGVGLYIDDVYMGTSVGANMELRDIASVQVLRGPQGTLVRTQHHRRRDRDDDQGPGRRVRRHSQARAAAPTA